MALFLLLSFFLSRNVTFLFEEVVLGLLNFPLGFQRQQKMGRGAPLPPTLCVILRVNKGVIAKSCFRVLKFLIGPYVTKILRFQTKKRIWDPPPYSPHYALFGGAVNTNSCLKIHGY